MSDPTIPLFQIAAHLRAAQVQSAPTDDAVVASHIDAALALTRSLIRASENEASMQTLAPMLRRITEAA